MDRGWEAGNEEPWERAATRGGPAPGERPQASLSGGLFENKSCYALAVVRALEMRTSC